MKKTNTLLIKKIKLLLPPLLTIIVILILTSRFLLPEISKLKTFSDTNKKERERLVKLENKLRKINEIKKSSLTADFEKAENILPSDKNIPLIFAAVSQLGAKSSVSVENFSLKPGILDKETDKKINTNIENINFNLNVFGNENQIVNFLDNILKSAPLFNINSVLLTKTDNLYKLTVDVLTYYQYLPASLGKIEEALPELSAEQKKVSSLMQNFILVSPGGEEIIITGSPSGRLTGKSIFEF